MLNCVWSSQVLESSAQSSGDHQEHHISVQEMQELKDTLSQAEAKSKSLESQVENLQKVWRGGSCPQTAPSFAHSHAHTPPPPNLCPFPCSPGGGEGSGWG